MHCRSPLLSDYSDFTGIIRGIMAKRKKAPENGNLKKWNNWYSEDKAGYQKYAESKRKHNRFNQERLTEIYGRMRDYVTKKQTAGEPLTIGGLQLSAGCNKMDFSRMRSGSYDWRTYQFQHYKGIAEADITSVHDDLINLDILYWTDEDGAMYILNPYSIITERFYMLIQEQLEALCYTSNNPRGAIFLLKSAFGWSDNQPEVQIITGGIHVASKEEAQEALKTMTK